MKKIISPLVRTVVYSVSCVTLLSSVICSQSFAGTIDKDNFRFNLFNQIEQPNKRFSFQLLDLNKIKNGKVAFSSMSIMNNQALTAIDSWQQQFRILRRDLKDQTSDESDEKSKVGIKIQIDKLVIDISGKDLKNLEQVLEAIDSEPDANTRLRKKIEVVSAFNERFKPPGEIVVDIATIVFKIVSTFTSYNVPVTEDVPVQVQSSSFWQDRKSSDADMIKGPGQFDVSRLATEVCEYDGPKKGFGVHIGFKIKCDDTKLKVKFGEEARSGSLNVRLYHRLGYNVPGIHFYNSLKVKYNRQLFSQINSRKDVAVPINLLGIHLTDVAKPKHFDAMNNVTALEMNDGNVLLAKENDLTKKLLKSCEARPCSYADENINTEFENQIKNIVFQQGGVIEDIGEEIGAWKYSDLDHADRTEINALLLVGAWTGNFDLRKDNTKLSWDAKTGELKHYISDPGSGLGDQTRAFNAGKRITGMRWTVTQDLKEPFALDMQKAIQLDFQTIVKHPAFQKLSYQEAQWMVRRIADISEDDVAEAVIHSGFAAAEFLLLKEKLVSIQQDYIKSFGLEKEYQFRLRPINKQLNFAQDSLIVALKNSRVYSLPSRGIKLVNGALVMPAMID